MRVRIRVRVRVSVSVRVRVRVSVSVRVRVRVGVRFRAGGQHIDRFTLHLVRQVSTVWYVTFGFDPSRSTESRGQRDAAKAAVSVSLGQLIIAANCNVVCKWQ